MAKKPTTKSRLSPRLAKDVGPKPAAKCATARKKAPKAGKPLSKADQLVDMLQRPTGASIAELQEVFGTRPHSLRAAISVQNRARALNVVLANGRYRVVA